MTPVSASSGPANHGEAIGPYRYSPIFDMELIMLNSGEILCCVGSYSGSIVRARLAYVPDANGDRLIDGTPYAKIRYEKYPNIESLSPVLNHPAEQHYLVPRRLIKRTYSGQTSVLEESHDGIMDDWFAFLEACGCGHDVRLTGSRALRCATSGSDYDWALMATKVQIVRDALTRHGLYRQELHFTLDHPRRKYSFFRGLTSSDIDNLMTRRWRNFRFGQVPMSLDFVDPNQRADELLTGARLGPNQTLIGTVVNGNHCLFSPRFIQIKTPEDGNVTLFTWLFLYNGALESGDTVQVVGAPYRVADRNVLLIEDAEHYIKLLDKDRDGRDSHPSSLQ